MSKNFADGFRVLADFIESNPIAGMEYPDQSMDIVVSLSSEDAVRQYAERFAAPVRQSVSENGSTHTTATFQFGPDNEVRLDIYHIENPS